MWYEPEARWFTMIFVALGVLFILLGIARLLYVWRRGFQPRDSILAAFALSFVETGLTPSQVVETQRDLYRSFHRASPWTFIGAGTGIILASLAQLALVTLLYRRIGDLLNTSPDYRALTPVEAGAIYGLPFGGLLVGAGVGLLFGVGLTPRDTNRAQAPARGSFDLISPGIVVVAFAPILALLGFTFPSQKAPSFRAGDAWPARSGVRPGGREGLPVGPLSGSLTPHPPLGPGWPLRRYREP